MPSRLSIRKDSPPWKAPQLGRVLARVARGIRLAERGVDGALRAELDAMEAQIAEVRRTQPRVQLPAEPYRCKDPHVRIRHDHGLLCVKAPSLASELEEMAQLLALPSAPDLLIPAFELVPVAKHAPPIIDVEASYAAFVREARARGWTSFEGGSADVRSVAYALAGPPGRLSNALLSLSKIQPTPGRAAIRELADIAYFAGSRLGAIAALIVKTGASCVSAVTPIGAIVERLRDLGKSLEALDAEVRYSCLFDPAPRRSHSRDVVYQEVLACLDAERFDDSEIARLVVPTSERDERLWQRRIGDHLSNTGARGLGTPSIDSHGTGFVLGRPSRWNRLRPLN
jgi:hypothetical protein